MAGDLKDDNKNALFMEEEFDILPDDEGDDDDITDTREAATGAKDSADTDNVPGPDPEEDSDPYGYEPLEGPSDTKKAAAESPSSISAPSSKGRGESTVPDSTFRAGETRKKRGLSGLFRFNYEDGSEKHLEELFSGRKGDEKAGRDKYPEGHRTGRQRAGGAPSQAAEEAAYGSAAEMAGYSPEPPVGMAAYLGYMLLFSVPVVGVIILLVQAFAAKNSAVRTFARAFLCFMIIMLLLLTELALLGVTKYLF